jgi:hypothetical protein
MKGANKQQKQPNKKHEKTNLTEKHTLPPHGTRMQCSVGAARSI